MQMTKRAIAKTDTIITAFASPAAGPGWANSPVWIVVRSQDGSYREVCLQPEEQSPEMLALYDVSATVNRSMIAAACRICGGRPR
jgi:hypothetical protein